MKPPQIKITYSHRVPISKLPRLTSIIESNEFCRSLFNKETIDYEEELHIILMNNALRVLGTSCVSNGGRNGTIMDNAKIAQIALKSNASRLIVTHNHPSGNRLPSEADIRNTKSLKSALALLDIHLVDHMIVTSDSGSFSFANENIL
jgi:DNA repair protein RadC